MRGGIKWILLGTAIAIGAAIAFMALQEPTTAPTSPDPRKALIDAATTRALGIESPAAIRLQLDAMPVGVLDRNPDAQQYRETLWSLFFKGSLLKLGDLASERPLALLYNPLLDIALVQGCEVAANGQPVKCDTLCALPGEALAGGAVTPAGPDWLVADDPLLQLQQLTSTRVRSFEQAHPPDGANAAPWREDYCKEKLQTAAELRLIAGAGALSGLDSTAFQVAIADYIQKAASKAGQSDSANDDVVLQLLLNASELSLAGAVPLGDQGWLVFLMPNRNGWRQAVLQLSKAPDGRLAIEGAHLMSFTTAKS